MNSSELLRQFRLSVVDTAKPYLWSDEELWPMMNDAYSMFVRLTGGISDFTSSLTEVSAVAGEPTAEVSKKILRFMSARRASDNREVEIINSTDIGRASTRDYGRNIPFTLGNNRGPVRAMVIGMQRGIVRWIDTPDVDDTIHLHVYRLPLDTITGDNQEFVDVDEQHHLHLLLWMKSLAYRKQDADAFDPNKAAENEVLFRQYCGGVKAEFDREKHKNRVVAYGGI